eukprot:TRINITY_DN8422_c0_g1_i1.p1 TRINITY_DN8422_c0_g1~~TRINITY_DN8422_c0_g1_i1.p1  ORF type:complete len:526 (-),score=27.84 TRINITY_DN8422_c0_g1_i1:90-1499(-)
MNLSVQLAIGLCFGGCVMITYCGIAYFGHGELYSLPRWFAAFLFTLPFTVAQIVCYLIFLLVILLTRSSLNSLVSSRKFTKRLRISQVAVIAALLALIIPICVVADIYEDSKLFIISYAACFMASSIGLIVACVVLRDEAIKTKRIRKLKVFVITLHSIWIIVLALHMVFAEILSDPNQYGPWMALIGADLCYLFIMISLLGFTCYDHGYTTVALQMIKPTSTVAIVGAETGSAKKFTPVNLPFMDKVKRDVQIYSEEEIQLSLSRTMVFWRNRPKRFKDIFNFPHPINELDSVLHAIITCVHILIILSTSYFFNWPWWWIPVTAGMLFRFASGPLYDPQAWLVVAISSRFKPHYIAGPPKRIAQLIGFIFSAASFILFMMGQAEASYWLLAAMFIFSFLQGAYRQCASCFSFYTLLMFNVLPSQTCDKCKIQFTSDDTIIQQLSQSSSNTFSATVSPRGGSDTSVNRA